MSIGYIRKWSDTGAPKLWSNAYGSMVRLLEAVLVNGYGTTPGLGWTKVYSSTDTNTVVFRNSQVDGSGFFLQVSHSSTYGYATNFFRINAFESMTDWETGLSKCPPIGINAINILGYSTSATCADGIHWTIVGDNRGFWLCLRYYLSTYADIISQNSGRIWRVIYIGDIIPFDSANQWPVVVMGSTTATAANVPLNNIQTMGSVNDLLWVMRDSTLLVGAAKVGYSCGSYYETTSIGTSPNFSPMYGQQMLTPILMHDVNSKLIGMLPGARSPLRKYGVAGTADWSVCDEVVIGYNRTLHTLLSDFRGYSTDSSLASRICLISGEGFRDAI